MEQGHTLPRVSFVVRLWLEGRDAAGQPKWRLQVIHVQSGEQTHCRSLADLLAFVERQAGVAGPRFWFAAGHGIEEVQP